MDYLKRGNMTQRQAIGRRPVSRRLVRGIPPSRRPVSAGNYQNKNAYYHPRPFLAPPRKITPGPGGRKFPGKKPGTKESKKKFPRFLIIGLVVLLLIMLIIFILVKSANKRPDEPDNNGIPGENLEMKISDVLIEGDLIKVTMDIQGQGGDLDSIKFVILSSDNQEVFLEKYSNAEEFFLNLKNFEGEQVVKISVYPILKDSEGVTFTGEMEDSYYVIEEEPPTDDYNEPPVDYYNYDDSGLNDTTGLNDTNTSDLNNSFQNNSYVNCTPHYISSCYNGDVYWYNSCGQREEIKEDCTSEQACFGNVCVSNCTPHYISSCYNGDVYWYNSCGQREGIKQSCSLEEECVLGECVPDENPPEEPFCGNGIVEGDEFCDGTNLSGAECGDFGYDSGELSCSVYVCEFDISGCYNNGGTQCTSHYTSSCYNGDVYWYDSCGQREEIKQDCTSEQTCSGGLCVDNPEPWETGLVSWWNFNSNAEDSVGNNDGNVYGATITGSGCKSGGCCDFDGINDYIDVGTFSVSGNQLTISAWATYEGSNYAVDPRIISKAHGTEVSDHVFLLGLDDTSSTSARYRFRFTSGAGTTNYVAGSATPQNGWKHIVAVYDGSAGVARIYVDGSLIGTTSASGNLQINSDSVHIGDNPVHDAEGGRYWNGKLDEIMIWNRALSSNEVSDIYNYF